MVLFVKQLKRFVHGAPVPGFAKTLEDEKADPQSDPRVTDFALFEEAKVMNSGNGKKKRKKKRSFKYIFVFIEHYPSPLEPRGLRRKEGEMS